MRDDDYLRALLQEFEASEEWTHYSELLLGAGDADVNRHFHILLLVDGGLMASMGEGTGEFRITNDGHDFLAMTRDEDRWKAVKAAGQRISGASVQMLYRIAESYARAKLSELGVPLA